MVFHDEAALAVQPTSNTNVPAPRWDPGCAMIYWAESVSLLR